MSLVRASAAPSAPCPAVGAGTRGARGARAPPGLPEEEPGPWGEGERRAQQGWCRQLALAQEELRCPAPPLG